MIQKQYKTNKQTNNKYTTMNNTGRTNCNLQEMSLSVTLFTHSTLH